MSNSLRVDNSLEMKVVSAVTSQNSTAIDVGGAEGYSALVTLADVTSGVGTVALEGSLDGTTFVELNGSSQTIAFVSSAQKMLFTVQKPTYKWVRVAYTRTSGTLTIQAEVTVIEGTF